MKRLFILGLLASLALSALAQPQMRKDNLDEILQALTVEEKANLLVGLKGPGVSVESIPASMLYHE